MKQVLQSIKDDGSSLSFDSIIGLTDDNGDYCYGVFPSIQK